LIKFFQEGSEEHGIVVGGVTESIGGNLNVFLKQSGRMGQFG